MHARIDVPPLSQHKTAVQAASASQAARWQQRGMVYTGSALVGDAPLDVKAEPGDAGAQQRAAHLLHLLGCGRIHHAALVWYREGSCDASCIWCQARSLRRAHGWTDETGDECRLAWGSCSGLKALLLPSCSAPALAGASRARDAGSLRLPARAATGAARCPASCCAAKEPGSVRLRGTSWLSAGCAGLWFSLPHAGRPPRLAGLPLTACTSPHACAGQGALLMACWE